MRSDAPERTDGERALALRERLDPRASFHEALVMAVQGERERCAKVAEHMADWSEVADSSTGYAIAKRIRSGANP